MKRKREGRQTRVVKKKVIMWREAAGERVKISPKGKGEHTHFLQGRIWLTLGQEGKRVMTRVLTVLVHWSVQVCVSQNIRSLSLSSPVITRVSALSRSRTRKNPSFLIRTADGRQGPSTPQHFSTSFVIVICNVIHLTFVSWPQTISTDGKRGLFHQPDHGWWNYWWIQNVAHLKRCCYTDRSRRKTMCGRTKWTKCLFFGFFLVWLPTPRALWLCLLSVCWGSKREPLCLF